MLPVTLRGLSGTRLLQEYFAFPQRFLFSTSPISARAFAKATRQHVRDRAALQPLRRRRSKARSTPTTSSCTACRRSTSSSGAPTGSHLDEGVDAFHLVPTAPPAGLRGVRRHSACAAFATTARSSVFLPLFAAPQAEPPGATPAYYSAAREPRLPSRSRQARRAALRLHRHRGLPVARRSARGAVPQRAAPARRADALHQPRPAAVHADGPAQGDLDPQLSAPIESIHIVAGPSRPQSAMREGASPGACSALLSLNYLSLLDSSPEQGATALREILLLFAHRRRRRPEAADRRRALGRRQAGGAPPSGGRADRLRPRARGPLDGRRPLVRGRQRLPVRRGAAPATSRATCR